MTLGLFGSMRKIDRARFRPAREYLLPGRPAVGGFENAALIVRAELMPQRGYEDDVRIARIDEHFADLLGIFESDVLPGAAGVGGFVDSVAWRRVAADAGFAHARIDKVGIGFGDGDRADIAVGELAVGDGDPGRAAVGGLKNPPPVAPK